MSANPFAVSNLIGSSPGFSGRIGDQNTYIKQFTTDIGASLWYVIPSNIPTQPSTLTTVGNTNVYLKKDLIVEGKVKAVSYETVSDYWLKKNITDGISEEDANKLLKIKPVKYNYITDLDNKKMHYGMIAQDLEKIYPDLVETELDTNLKSINYMELIPILVAKIQNMQKEIDILKKERN